MDLDFLGKQATCKEQVTQISAFSMYDLEFVGPPISYYFKLYELADLQFLIYKNSNFRGETSGVEEGREKGRIENESDLTLLCTCMNIP